MRAAAIYMPANGFALSEGTRMKLVVCSDKDAASINITQHLLRLGDWQPAGTFEGAPVHRMGEDLVVTIPVHHLYFDDIDDKVEKALGARPSLVIFASRHKSASNMRTLTIHPIGNFAKAEMGGRDQTLVPAAPHEMTFALKELSRRAGGLNYQVSLEATHHGPFLRTPTFYIEIGSDEEAWKEPEPGRVIAETIHAVLTSEIPHDPIAVGVGGGHYVPRITDVAREKRISFGHMLPSYQFEGGVQPQMLESMLQATPGATMVYFHRKAIRTPVLRQMEAWFHERAVEPFSSKDIG
jgi:D-aminoacyl-tRNA deacylase